MFKLKPGNVIQKLSKMTRKQAYTWGAVVIVFFIALLMLASFMGDADDTSFENLNARGYDLAQMPFVNDEAEAYLLASKYPDMQGNNSSLLYSAEEKAARQAEDAANEESSAADDEASSGAGASSTRDSSYSGRSGRGYSGRGGSAGPTQVGQLGSASMGHASGSGVSSTFGAPRGDFSPYKTQEKGSEGPTQLQNQNARKALYQFARGSRAAAGYQDGKGANAKRALMGGNIQGSEAFTDKGVDLSKTGGLMLDTNAPVTSTDLSDLDDKVQDAADKAKNDKNKEEKDIWDKLLEQVLTGLTDIAVQGIGKMADSAIDKMFANMEANRESRQYGNDYLKSLKGATPDNCVGDCEKAMGVILGGTDSDRFKDWKSGKTLEECWGGLSDARMRRRLKRDGAVLPDSFSTDENGMYIGSNMTPKLDGNGNIVLDGEGRIQYERNSITNENSYSHTRQTVRKVGYENHTSSVHIDTKATSESMKQVTETNNSSSSTFRSTEEIDKFAKDNNYTEEQKKALHDKIGF